MTREALARAGGGILMNFTASRFNQATPPTLGQFYGDTKPLCEIGSALADVEFVYTGGWEEFTSRCCCRDHSWDPAVQNMSLGAAVIASRVLGAVELWTCPDLSPTSSSSPSGLLHKLRQREERDDDGNVVRSGRHLRPFCSPHFTAGLGLPTYNDELLAYVVPFAANGSIAGSDLW